MSDQHIQIGRLHQTNISSKSRHYCLIWLTWLRQTVRRKKSESLSKTWDFLKNPQKNRYGYYGEIIYYNNQHYGNLFGNIITTSIPFFNSPMGFQDIPLGNDGPLSSMIGPEAVSRFASCSFGYTRSWKPPSFESLCFPILTLCYFDVCNMMFQDLHIPQWLRCVCVCV